MRAGRCGREDSNLHSAVRAGYSRLGSPLPSAHVHDPRSRAGSGARRRFTPLHVERRVHDPARAPSQCARPPLPPARAPLSPRAGLRPASRRPPAIAIVFSYLRDPATESAPPGAAPPSRSASKRAEKSPPMPPTGAAPPRPSDPENAEGRLGFPRRPSQTSRKTLASPPRCPPPGSRASAKCGRWQADRPRAQTDRYRADIPPPFPASGRRGGTCCASGESLRISWVIRYSASTERATKKFLELDYFFEGGPLGHG